MIAGGDNNDTLAPDQAVNLLKERVNDGAPPFVVPGGV
jgi:hypothetical protein